MNINDWITIFSKAYAEAGQSFSPDVRRLLLAPLPESRTQEQLQRYAEAKDVMVAYFFRRVSQSESFGDPDRVRQQFGSTLEENYGVASGPFITLARTFWTFKIELNDLLPERAQMAGTQILLAIEQELASLFFPTPGPFAIPVQKRIEAQRTVLTESVPGFDVERFLSDNPLLRSDSVAGRRGGCFALGTALFACAGSMFASAMILFVS